MFSGNGDRLFMVNDDIIAISTAYGNAAIGVVRMSGAGVWKKALKHLKIDSVYERRAYYSKFFVEDKVLDDVVAIFFKSPHSYTGEDMVELSFHGNPIILSKAVRTFVHEGVRIAERGEFTKRAFVNGKMDLLRAEAVEKIVDSTSEAGISVSMRALNGELSDFVNRKRRELLEISANIEVRIDYPDEFDEEYMPDFSKHVEEIRKVLSTYDPAKTVIEGVKVVLIGAPNVGKSSILNALVGEERAIVTDVPGTTRDTVEAELRVNGLKVVLVDTAGIRESLDKVEKIGIERTMRAMREAHVKVHILDATSQGDELDIRADIVAVNKSDLARKSLENAVLVSAKTGEGIDVLREKIFDRAMEVVTKTESAEIVLVAERQYDLLRKCAQELEEAEEAVKSGMPVDVIDINVRKAIEFLDELVGRTYSEDVLDTVFSKFCVGK